MEEYAQWGLIAFVLAATAWNARQVRGKSEPQIIKKHVAEVVSALGHLAEVEAQLTARARVWTTEFEAIADRCDDVLDRATKRSNREKAQATRDAKAAEVEAGGAIGQVPDVRADRAAYLAVVRRRAAGM